MCSVLLFGGVASGGCCCWGCRRRCWPSCCGRSHRSRRRHDGKRLRTLQRDGGRWRGRTSWRRLPKPTSQTRQARSRRCCAWASQSCRSASGMANLPHRVSLPPTVPRRSVCTGASTASPSCCLRPCNLQRHAPLPSCSPSLLQLPSPDSTRPSL